jgi:heat shock protein HtpX
MKLMQFGKRVFLFLMVNILIVTTITIILSIFHVRDRVGDTGFFGLMIFCLIWGMGGAFISLLISRWMAKMMMGVEVIDPNTNDPQLRQLVGTVENLARSANIPMPEVGIYDSPEINAFATGPSKSRSLVAVSSGLLRNMRQPEVEGVLGHEISHIANGDMVTMTLLQGVVNAFAMLDRKSVG